jgi:hypothetical protein
MENRDNEQYNNPKGEPNRNTPDPQKPGDEREKDIRGGAENEDQLEKLQPDSEEDKAKNEIGSPPNSQVDKGE